MSVVNGPESTSVGEELTGKHVLRYLVPCECCGAGMTLVEEGAVCCEFCGQERLVGSVGSTPLCIPFAMSPEQALVEIKRWLRQEGHRATSLEAVEQVLVPYWRVRRRVLTWLSESGEEDLEHERCFDASMHRFEHFEPAIGQCDALGEGLPFGDLPMVVLPLDRAFVPDAAQLFAVTSEATSMPAYTTDSGANRTPGDANEEAPPDEAESGEDTISNEADEPEERLPSEYVPGPAPDEETETPDTLGIDPSPVREDQTCEIDRSVALVYVPFFTLRFTFQDEVSTVVACGCTGRTTGLITGELQDRYTLADRNAMLTVSGTLATRPLECPDCRGRLEQWGAIVRCQVCGVACRHEHGGLVTLTCAKVAGEGIRLPFWCFVERKAPGSSREPSVHADLDQNGEMPRRVWVPAFRPCPPVLARKLALLMTEHQPHLVAVETREVNDAEHLPCTRRVWSARAIAKLTAAEIDRRDVADASDGALGRMAPTLVWVPFERGAGLLTEPSTGIRITSAVVEEALPRPSSPRTDGNLLPG